MAFFNTSVVAIGKGKNVLKPVRRNPLNTVKILKPYSQTLNPLSFSKYPSFLKIWKLVKNSNNSVQVFVESINDLKWNYGSAWFWHRLLTSHSVTNATMVKSQLF